VTNERKIRLEDGELVNSDMEGMIGTFKTIANHPLSRILLEKTMNYCQKDEANSIEVGLQLMLGQRENACLKCTILSKIISHLVKKGIANFGVSESEFKQIMEDPYWVKGLSSVLKGIALFGVQKPFVPGAPFQVVWNITRRCNMKCEHCYENAGKPGKDELNSGEVLNGLDILSEAGVTSVALSGGEPTLHPHIHDFIKHAKDQGLFVAMATNGYLLSRQDVTRKFEDSGLEFVQISLDGLSSRTHDSFRGVSGAWDKAVQAISHCVDAGFFVEVATTVTEYNYQEIPQMMDFVRDLGVQWFMLYNFIPTGNGRKIVNSDISPEKRQELLENAYLENNRGDMQVLSTAPQYATIAESMVSSQTKVIPTHFYNPEYTSNTLKKLADFIGGCGAGRFYLSIEPNGDIFPCVFFPHDEEVCLGNILSDDFNDLWQHHELLDKFRNKNILKGHCGGCKSRNICGGCRARAYNYFGDVLAPDPGCVNNFTQWLEIKKGLPKGAQELADGRILIDLKYAG